MRSATFDRKKTKKKQDPTGINVNMVTSEKYFFGI